MHAGLFMAAMAGLVMAVMARGADPGFRVTPAAGDAGTGYRMEWTGAAGREYYVRHSPDLRDWLLLPWLVEGDGTQVEKTLDDPADTLFFQLVGRETVATPWVTDAATTPRAGYQLLYSEAVGGPVSFHVYLPPPYALQPLRRFPVLYWLHGSGPGVLGIPALTQYFHDAIQARHIPPMIVVFPNGLPDGMWCDSKDGARPVETMVIEELIPHIDRRYRTLADRSGRIVEGFSMGGYGAARFGLKHHRLFGAFSMMGAGPLQLDFLEDNPLLVPIEQRREIFATVYGSDMDYFEAQSPWRLAEMNATSLPPDLAIRQIVGQRDAMLPHNRLLHQRLVELGIAHEYTELEGIGHNAMDVLNALGAANFEFYNRVLRPGGD